MPAVGDIIIDERTGGGGDSKAKIAVRMLTAEDFAADCVDEAALNRLMALVVIPLFGTDVVFPGHTAGQAYRAALIAEGVQLTGGVGGLQAAVKGGYRRLLETALAPSVTASAEPDGSTSIAATFSLRSGVYATSLLRELLCNHDVI